MLPQHLVYKNKLNREYVITLARNDKTPWWWSEKIETCRSGFKCFKWKLYRCICWLIVEVKKLICLHHKLHCVPLCVPHINSAMYVNTNCNTPKLNGYLNTLDHYLVCRNPFSSIIILIMITAHHRASTFLTVSLHYDSFWWRISTCTFVVFCSFVLFICLSVFVCDAFCLPHVFRLKTDTKP